MKHFGQEPEKDTTPQPSQNNIEENNLIGVYKALILEAANPQDNLNNIFNFNERLTDSVMRILLSTSVNPLDVIDTVAANFKKFNLKDSPYGSEEEQVHRFNQLRSEIIKIMERLRDAEKTSNAEYENILSRLRSRS